MNIPSLDHAVKAISERMGCLCPADAVKLTSNISYDDAQVYGCVNFVSNMSIES